MPWPRPPGTSHRTAVVPGSNGACIQPQGKPVKDDDPQVQAVGRPEDTGWANKKRVLNVGTATLKRILTFLRA